MNNINSFVFLIAFFFAVSIPSGAYVLTETIKADRMSSDLKMAAEKGIDPMNIRCAWAASTDTICLIYTSKQKSNPVVLQ